MFYLGIDGGGSKTRAVIAERTGRIRADIEVGSINPHGLPQGRVEEELTEMVRRLAEQCNIEDITTVFAGIAGIDHRREREAMQNALAKALPGKRLTLATDAVIALASGTYGAEGIVLIAGTGSVAYARLEDGSLYRVGGWGYLMGDEGSGYALGQRALTAVMRAYDGRSSTTSLSELILRKSGCPRVEDIVPFLYAMPAPKRWIASLSYEAILAYEAEDAVSQVIVAKTCDEQKEQIDALLKKVRDRIQNPIIVLTGGLFQKAGKVFFQGLNERYRQEGRCAIASSLLIPQLPPVAGAVIEAMKSDGLTLLKRKEDQTDFIRQWLESEGQAHA